jgi:TRAP transporter TAXI family solute receptor
VWQAVGEPWPVQLICYAAGDWMTGQGRRRGPMRFYRTLSTLAVLAAACMLGCSPGSQPTELRVGTASLGGAYYPLGQGIANLINAHVPGRSMIPVVTRGAVDNPRLLTTGDIDLGITNADLAYFAYQGQAPYPAPLAVLAAGALHPSVLHMVVLERSGIRTFSDLRGKRVAVGPVGGPTALMAQRLLEAHGLSLDDVVASYLAYSDGFGQLTDGNVDAAFALAGFPAAGVVQTQASQAIALIDLDASRLAGMLADNPYYRLLDIPAASYGLAADTTALAVDNLLLVRRDEDPDLVYAMTEAIYSHLDELTEHDAVARYIDPTQSMRLAVPLHPGAQRYFEQR